MKKPVGVMLTGFPFPLPLDRGNARPLHRLEPVCATLAAAVPARAVGNIWPADAVSWELAPRGTKAAWYRSTFPPTVEVSHAARTGCPDERGRSACLVRPHSHRHDDPGGRPSASGGDRCRSVGQPRGPVEQNPAANRSHPRRATCYGAPDPQLRDPARGDL